MRHHAHQLSTLALAGALTLVGCGQQTVRDISADVPASVERSTSIPDDFPLSAGMAAPEDDIATSRTGSGLRDLELCGTAPLRGLSPRDRMVADNSGGEALDTRELVLMGSPEEAARVAGSFVDLTTECETTGEDLETVTQVRGSALGRPSPAVTLLQTYEQRGEPVAGTMVIHVVPAGSALLVTMTYGEWAGDDLAAGIAGTVDAVRPTVAALAEFEDGTPTPTPTPTPSSGEESGPIDPTAISDNFPLGAGLPQDGGDLEVEAQADEVTATTGRIAAAMCVFTRTGC